MIRLEFHIDWKYTLGITTEWKWKGRGHKQPYETSDHQNKICFNYGFFYYERDSDPIDHLLYYNREKLLNDHLEWNDVTSILELLEKHKDYISPKRYNKYKRIFQTNEKI